jgi:hypothetical protein
VTKIRIQKRLKKRLKKIVLVISVRVQGFARLRYKKGTKGHPILIDPNLLETIDITPNLEKYQNNPIWEEIDIIRPQVIDVKITKNVKEYLNSYF